MTDPFAAELNQMNAQARQPVPPAQDDPFAAELTALDTGSAPATGIDATSRRSIAASLEANAAQNIAKLKALMEMPGVTAAQKTRIQRLIKTMTEPTFYNRVTDQDRFFGSNLLRGLASGVVGDALLGTVDALGGVAQFVGKGVDAATGSNIAEGIKKGRERVAEAQQIVREDLDAQGVSGAIGRVAGAVGGGLIGGGASEAGVVGGGIYGAAASKTIGLLTRFDGAIGTAARLGSEGTFIQRALVNLVANLPFDAIQALTLPETDAVKIARGKQENGEPLLPEDENALDDYYHAQLAQFALATSVGTIGGAVVETGTKALGTAVSRIKAGAAGRQLSQQELASTADALLELGQLAEARSKARRAASGAWNQGNTMLRRKMLEGLTNELYDTDYKDLPPDIKQALIETFGGPKIGPELPPHLRSSAQPTPPPAPPASGAPGQPPPPTTPGAPTLDEQALAGASGEAVSRMRAQAGGAGSGAGEARKLDAGLTEVEARLAEMTARAEEAERRLHATQRAVQIDQMTGAQTKDAWLDARPRVDADPETEVVIMDIGNLKGINDLQSFDHGDEAIRRAGESARQHMGNGYQLFRFGGDELVSAVPAGQGQGFARAAAETYGVQPVGDTGLFTHLRIGVGKTFKEANAALEAAKDEEIRNGIKRYRPKGGAEVAPKPPDPVMPEVPHPVPSGQIETGPHTKVGEPGPLEPLDPSHPVDAVLYRGVTEGSTTEGPLFFTRDSDVAAHFASDEFPGAEITQQHVKVQKPASVDDLKQAIRDVGINPDDYGQLSDYVLKNSGRQTHSVIDALFVPEVTAKLKSKGFDGLVGLDETLGEGIDPHVVVAFDKSQATKLSTKEVRPVRTAESELTAPPKPPKRTIKQVDKDIAATERNLEKGVINEKEAEVRLAELGKEKRDLKAAQPKEPKVAAAGKSELKVKLPDTVGKDLSTLPQEQLTNAKRSLRSLIQTVERGSPEDQALQTEFKRILEFEAKRDGGQGVVLYMHPSIVGGVGGFMAGFAFPADDEETRLKNAVLFGAVGIAGGVYAARRWGPGTRALPKLQPWEEEIAKKVVSGRDLTKPPKPFMMRLRGFYNFFARRSGAIESATAALGGKELPVQRNAGKLAAIFGRWQAQTESFLLDQPSLVGKDGNIVWLDALPAQKIMAKIDGDTDKLGFLMAAARALELGARGIRTGIDAMSARMTFVKADPIYHEAMGDMRKFNAALVDVADDAGLVADREKMSDTFYAPLNRIFGGAPGTAPVKQTITSKVKSSVGVPNPIKALKGGTQLILNPAEATIGNTPRILRAAELNKIGTAFADLLDAADPTIARQIGQRLHGSALKKVPGYAVKVQQLQSEMAALGSTISREEAERIVHTFSNEALSVQDDVLRIWRQGKLEQWRLNPEVAKSFRSLNPDELHSLIKFLGMPTNFARFGITNNPMFVARQAFRDNWQAWLNSEYGFIPVIDQVRGWFHIITRSKAYKEYLAGGGGYGALAEQRFARGITALPDVQRAPTKNELSKALQEIRELKPLKAYQTLINPVIESARVGEYLRARGAGASVIESVFAAKHVTGNFQQIGSGMRAANHLTLFLNPAIQSLDASARAFARNPVSYLTKAFVGIVLPSWYFWNAYQKDEELNQLRKTETGRRYWWARAPNGTIVKIPKPIFDGQVFGSTVETVLDREKLKDPESSSLTRDAIVNDIAVNLLPQIGAIPISMWANKDLGTGAPIVPDRVSELDPQYQFGPKTSLAARVVGKETHTSPAQIDYAIKATFGQLGANTVRIISNAVEYQETGYVPPKEELPFFEEVFARYPSLNVGAIREFYKTAGKVDEVAKTIGHAAKFDAENVDTYILSNPAEAGMIDLFKDARENLAELRNGIEEIRAAPPQLISPADKRIYIDELMRAMIETAKATNTAAQEVRKGSQGIHK